MIHRAIFGSLERFFGIMTENYAGDFPFWLAAEQIRLLPVTDEALPWAQELEASSGPLEYGPASTAVGIGSAK